VPKLMSKLILLIDASKEFIACAKCTSSG